MAGRGTTFGRQFQVIFENAPIGIAVMDGAGSILYTNHALQRFIGYSDLELSGTYLSSYSYQTDSELFRTLYSELIEGERQDFQLASRCQKKNGEIAWWQVDARAVLAEGYSPFILAVVDDVTAQKSNEQELRRAKEMAEQATRTKSAFLANMSHEIRTPLHTITGLAELLSETRLDEEQSEYATQIRFAGEVLLGLINDILDFSKIEAGKLHLESIKFDLLETIENAVDMVGMHAHRKGLEMVLFVDPALPSVVIGDPSRLRQVIVNLVNNAVKFTESGEIRVTAELKVSHNEPRCLIQVRDTGIGVSRERQEVLFQPFSQVDSSTTRKYGGTGLGLSITRDLVHLMGGAVGLKSKVGVGSNFWFALPLNIVDPVSRTARVPRGLNPGTRVLVVDDNHHAAAAVGGYLTSWRAIVDHAGDAASAVTILRHRALSGTPISLILIDLRLKQMDGWQLAGEIRDQSELSKCKLILMSPAGSSSGEAKMKLLRWFDAYITKPVKLADLCVAIEATMSGEIEELEMVEPEDDGTTRRSEADAADIRLGQDEPATQRRFAASPPGPPVHSAKAAETETLAKLILVVEDHFVNQQLFLTILRKRGYRTVTASNGLEAIERAQESAIDLVFMDVQMPLMNGYDATQKIRELGYQMPIIAVTANALKGERERCVRAGMNDFLTKPFKAKDIDLYLQRLESGYYHLDEAEELLTSAPIAAEGGEALREEPAPVADPTDDPEIFDYDAALDAFMGDAETLKRVVDGFVERIPRQIENVRSKSERGDFAGARIEAHALKGGSWNLAALRLGNAAKKLEDAAHAEDGPALTSHLPEVEREARVFIQRANSIFGTN